VINMNAGKNPGSEGLPLYWSRTSTCGAANVVPRLADDTHERRDPDTACQEHGRLL